MSLFMKTDVLWTKGKRHFFLEFCCLKNAFDTEKLFNINKKNLNFSRSVLFNVQIEKIYV